MPARKFTFSKKDISEANLRYFDQELAINLARADSPSLVNRFFSFCHARLPKKEQPATCVDLTLKIGA